MFICFLTTKTNKHYHSAGKIREQIWVPILKKANVEYRNLHQTRGTFISTLISNGEDINYVSKIAGHENVKITLERYSQYIPVQDMNFGKCFKAIQTLSELRELGFSRSELLEYGRMKDSPATKTKGGGKYLFDTERLEQKMFERNRRGR